MTRPTSLLVMDDHQGFVDALALYANEENDLALIGVATTARDGLDLLERVACDVVVVAYRLLADRPHGDGDVVTATRALRADLPILLLVGDDDGRGGADLLDVVAAGVHGWVDRSSGLEALVRAVLDVACGESHVPAEQAQALLAFRAAQRLQAVSPNRVRVLTGREATVLRCLAAGLSRAEISVSLDLSPNTVRTHVRSILRKYHVHSAPDAVALLTQMEPSHD